MPDAASLEPPAAPPPGATESSRYDVFLSYAREDMEFVETLTRGLESSGKKVFVDLDSIPPGAKWREKVWRGIEAAKAVVFVLSPDSVASRVCSERSFLVRGRVFDWERRTTLAELRAGTAVLTAGFSPDGVLLVTGDGQVATVWDWRLEQPIRDVGGPPQNSDETSNPGVMDASFSSDASRIVTAGADGRAHVYSCEACAPLGELLDDVRRGPRKLSADERRRYLPGGG